MKLLMEKQESTTPSSQGGPTETPRRFKFTCACPEPVLANDQLHFHRKRNGAGINKCPRTAGELVARMVVDVCGDVFPQRSGQRVECDALQTIHESDVAYRTHFVSTIPMFDPRLSLSW